jgi:hypothetical protein
MICLVMAFYFAYMHANSPGKEHKKKTTLPSFVCKPLAAANLDQSSWKQAPKHLLNAIF